MWRTHRRTLVFPPSRPWVAGCGCACASGAECRACIAAACGPGGCCRSTRPAAGLGGEEKN